ncbi:hypothetical protein GDO86_004864, partial [Hymenochirus boettgeri]
METINSSSFHPKYFILMGIPGLEESHVLLSTPFCCLYTFALVGNSFLLFIIGTNERFHQPINIWFKSHEILFNCCLLQVFFIHYLFVIESSILLIMAYDRYVAICFPLTYKTTLSNSFIVTASLIALFRAFCIITPLVLLLDRLPYQNSKTIDHTYCEHMGVAKLATADTLVNSVYGLVAASSSTGIDFIFIVASYINIFRAVLRLPSSEDHFKAFNTCVSHLCVILLFYIPAFFSFIAHRVSKDKIPPSAHIMLANLYVLVPPMMNPIIYGVRTKDIRQKVWGIFFKQTQLRTRRGMK